ncbi:hypothetical protein KDM41_12275, partial [bacterium]|nr:hypothetical protein [bacterium]
DADKETRLAAPGWARAEGRAVLLACAAALGDSARDDDLLAPAAALAAIATAGGPAPRTASWARLDGNFPWSPLPPAPPVAAAPDSVPSPDGPPWPARGDRHVLELVAGDDWQLWLLDRDPSGWRATRLLPAADPTP